MLNSSVGLLVQTKHEWVESEEAAWEEEKEKETSSKKRELLQPTPL
jgi:hypothetical protein